MLCVHFRRHVLQIGQQIQAIHFVCASMFYILFYGSSGNFFQRLSSV